MTNRRSNRALSTTRRWTAGVLLASTLVTGGVGIHLAEAYAAQPSTQSSTVSTTTSSGSSGSTSSFGTTGSVSSSLNSASTTTAGS